MQDTVVLDRAQLHEQVWNEPIMSVAPKLGVSGVALAKICRKMGVPVPGRGYWARVKAGRTPARIALPPLRAGQAEQHEFYPGRRAEVAGMAPSVIEKVQAEKATDNRIKVPAALRNPHHLVASAGPLLRDALKKGATPPVWSMACLDIFVSTKSLDRALRVMDALIKALEARGYPVEVTKPSSSQYESDRRNSPSTTGARINGFLITFGIEEDWDRVRQVLGQKELEDHRKWWGHDPQPRYDKKPSGRLILRLKTHGYGSGTRQNWKDRDAHPIEDHLNDFIAAMVVEGERERLEKEERDRQHRVWEEQRAQEELQKKLEADLERRLVAWDRAKRLRDLAAAVRDRENAAGRPPETGSAVWEWLDWVRRVAAAREREALDGIASMWPL